jgi:ABC-2 type transport system permease protein
MKLVKKISRYAAMEWSRLLQYRTDILLWMVAEAATPIVALAIWYTIAQKSTQGPSPKETLTYYILVIFLIIITNAWGGYFLSMDILKGNIVSDLMKPFSPFWRHILNNIVEKSIKLAIPIPLLALALWLFPHIFAESIYNPKLWPFFILSVIVGATLGFTLDIVFGIIAFWVEDSQEIRHYKDSLHMITSGILIPIAVMPLKAQTIVNALPFRNTITTPVEILLGRLSGSELVSALALQIAWLLVTIGLVAFLWKKGIKIYAPPGQ